MEWKKVASPQQIDELIDLYGGFHDSCLVEMVYCSECYVSTDLRMGMSESNTARIVFQRQYEQPRTIELKFKDIKRINIIPTAEGYSPEILGATLFLNDGVIYWAATDYWDLTDNYRSDITWIGAKELSYRIID